MFADPSDTRLTLLNQLYQHMLLSHLGNALQGGGSPRFSPPPFRYPATSNPFGLRMPVNLTAPATHGQGWEIGPGAGHQVQLVGQNTGGGGPTGPPVQPPVGPPFPAPAGGPYGDPRFSPPAMRPPAGIGPLPGH